MYLYHRKSQQNLEKTQQANPVIPSHHLSSSSSSPNMTISLVAIRSVTLGVVDGGEVFGGVVVGVAVIIGVV